MELRDIPVPYTEMLGSGNASYDDQGGQATLILLCDYDRADELCQYLMGWTQQIGLGLIVRHPPCRHPKRAYLYCRSARYDGMGVPNDGVLIDSSTGLAKYHTARVTAEFRPLDRDEDDQQGTQDQVFMTESREFTATMQTVDGRFFNWNDSDLVDNGKSINKSNPIPFGIRIPEMMVNLDVENWATAPVSNSIFENAVGKVNDNDIRFLWTKWPKQTLLFEGASMNRQWTSQGISAWKVSLRFRFRRSTWQKLLSPQTLRFHAVQNGNGDKMFEEYDFKKLIP